MKRSTRIVVGGASVLAAASAAVLPAAATPLVVGGDARAPVGQTTQVATLTAVQKSQLAFWVEEERLAHDLYVALAAKYPNLPQFAAIANSEAQHMAAVQQLLRTYGVADPTTGKPPGVFSNPQLAALYRQLLNSATTPAAALVAGATVERKDIADLSAARATAVPADVLRVINSQINASQSHLRAFTR